MSTTDRLHHVQSATLSDLHTLDSACNQYFEEVGTAEGSHLCLHISFTVQFLRLEHYHNYHLFWRWN
jgi:hypothetical protein